MATPNTMRKDVTPRSKRSTQEKVIQPKKSGSAFARITTSLIAGALGGMLVIGGYGYINKDNAITSPTEKTEQNTKSISEGKNTVSQMKVDVQTDTTKAVEKVKDAVVSVTTLRKQQSQLSDLERIFGPSNNEEKEGELQESGEGSGVIYRKDGDKAYIVTNNHVVAGADAVSIMISNGERVDAKIVGTDVYSDLAVLEIPSKNVTTVAEFADSDDIKVGEPALAIGSPLGSTFANSVSQGIVSAKDRMISNKTEDGQTINSNAIQTDAAINPGNSGGALVNTGGQVIGINSSKIAQAAMGVSAEGMGFAIPSNDVVTIINQLETSGKVIRPMLGISMINLSMVSAEEKESVLGIKDADLDGVVVGTVEAGSPAANAGIEKYDVITHLDDKKVTSNSELQATLYNKKMGDSMTVTLYQQGKKKKVDVLLDQDSSKLMENNMQQQEEESSKSPF